MPSSTKSIIHALTPPIVWKLARKLAKKQPPARNSAAVAGEQQPAEYYNQFGVNDHLKKHYTQSKYYPTWLLITDHLLGTGCRRILDIGCGPAQFAKLLFDNGFTDYTGIDFSEARVSHAREVCPGFTFMCRDVFEEGLVENLNYDAVVMTEFLEHINEDIAIIRRLKPGSRIFGTVPNYGDKAHVRKYESVDDLHSRYGGLTQDLRVMTVPITDSGRCLQLFEGIRNEKAS